jgi:hypothetical protein
MGTFRIRDFPPSLITALGRFTCDPHAHAIPGSERNVAMVYEIRRWMDLTSLQDQRLEDPGGFHRIVQREAVCSLLGLFQLLLGPPRWGAAPRQPGDLHAMPWLPGALRQYGQIRSWSRSRPGLPCDSTSVTQTIEWEQGE